MPVAELPDSVFKTEAEKRVAKAAYEEIQHCEYLANSEKLLSSDVQKVAISGANSLV